MAKTCEGYPRRGGCDQPVHVYPWGKAALWCKEHDDLRIETISRNMDAMIERMAKDDEEARQQGAAR